MNHKDFLAGLACAALGGIPAIAAAQSTNRKTAPAPAARRHPAAKHPRAITMWEFSWIERRWDGAGYEDWDLALDQLRERGYDAVRIDPFPHLLATDPHRTWTLLPEWNTQLWGSPDVNRIVLAPALFQFLAKCKARGIMAGLSTWFRQDADNLRMKITGPEVLASHWLKTLGMIREAGLLDTILYVDLCNEWPGPDWAPFLKPQLGYGDWDRPESLAFMHQAIALVRAEYPELPLLFSCSSERVENYLEQDIRDFDLVDPHTWMTQENGGEFYRLTDYNYERFDAKGYTNLSLKAEQTYRARPQYWQGLLTSKIDRLAAVSAKARLPLVTTECWAIVDYKDWPLLKWDWVKDLCALGARRAAASGRWLAIATSNFCGPQFVGMWRDKAWHQAVTRSIRTAAIAEDLREGRLYKRL